MSWLRIDDKFPRHPKVVGLSDQAFRLHMAAMGHCAEYETDGRIKTQVLDTLTKHRNKPLLVHELCEAGLWETLVGGWELHDYLDWNPSHSELQAKRDAAKQRMNAGRARSVRANDARTNTEPAAAVRGRFEDSCAGAGTQAQAGLLASESGSDPDPEGRPSEVRLKSVPPPANDHPIRSPEHVAIALQIRAHDCFRGVDAHHVADHHVGRMQGTGQKLEWAITAINECAEKKGGLGLTAEAMQGALVGFLKAGRGERREQTAGEVKSGSAYVEDDDEETVERIRRMPKRVTAQDAAKAAVGRGGAG